MKRRTLLLASTALVPLGIGLARAQTPDERRLERRLELWATYARKTETLIARYTSTRTSSLLKEPLVNTGTLGFIGPDTFVMEDDAMSGSRTIIEGGRVRIEPKQKVASEELPSGRVDPRRAPGLVWLKNRFLACFAADDDMDLVAGVEANAPRGRRPRIEVRPSEGSPVRKQIRVVVLELDPVGGAIVRIQIDEAQGDAFVLGLADHRQNVERTEIDRLLRGES